MVTKLFRSRSLLIGAVAVAVGVALAGCASGGGSSSAGGGTATGSGSSQGGFKIGYSNSMLGNTFHQVLIANAKSTAQTAQQQGLISEFTETDANNSAATQAQQIRSFIVQHYNAIIVDASSATALNSAIQEACAAGIVVVAVNETVTAPCAYNVIEHYPMETQLQIDAIGQALGGHGTILDDRGIAGTLPETLFQQGIAAGLKQYPNLKIVGSVYGQWTTTITDQQISQALPSLPTIQAVVSEGAGEVGVVQAFQVAHRPVPLVYFGNAGADLRVWAGLLKTNPNYHVFSISSFPSVSGFGIWTAIDLLQHKVPVKSKTIWFPLLEITQSKLQAWIAATAPDSQASFPFSYSQTQQLLKLEPNVPAVITPGPHGSIPGLS
jgi:ribose transport system substrate-binding protein